MSGLILNFDESNPQPLKRTQITTTPGNWTHKLKQKRKARHLEKKNAQPLQPKAITHRSDSRKIDEKSQKSQEIVTQSEPLKENELNDTDQASRSHKKPRLSKPIPAKPSSKIQVISSLFSSTIIPTIKLPPANDDEPSLTVCAPSNASLSEISITSSSLNLHPQISSHLSSHPKMGPIKSPTGIQSIAWPLLTSQSSDFTRDVIIQSQTGSGKTLAYLVPIIQDLLSLAFSKKKDVWTREIGTLAIILVPTRELAEQVYGVTIKLLGFARGAGSQIKDEKDSKPDEEDLHENFGLDPEGDGLNPRWLVPGTLHGGTNRTHEKARLRRGLPLLVCTPGRLLDHLEKTTSLRIAGETLVREQSGQNPNHIAVQKYQAKNLPDGDLNLRWLVVDEADRLMDMGFEEQMRGILKHLTDRENKTLAQRTQSVITNRSRRTILCSATMPDGVKKLVGLTLKDPIILRADHGNTAQIEAPEAAEKDEEVHQTKATFSAPSQLSQHYVITPPKLRLVSLLALLRQITNRQQRSPAEKVLVFMSCTSSVDFHFEAVGGVVLDRVSEAGSLEKSKHIKGEDGQETNALPIMKNSSLLPGVKIFRLHGNLDLQTRLASLKAFSKPREPEEEVLSSILFCTSLAGRGLDVPFVSHVIQYDLPTEGGVTEYLHRVGRTARAGQTGQAWSMLLPSEEGWVNWCEANQKDDSSSAKLKQMGVEKLLQDGFGGKCQKDWETRATDVQMAIERWVIESPKNTALASTGFGSHIRAYATHPSEEKKFFHVKNLHLGHLAKSFGLREAPKQLSSSYGSVNNPLPKTNNRKHKRLLTQQNKHNTNHHQLEGEGEDESGETDDDDYRQMPGSTFEVLSQFQHKKNGNRLRGPITNTADEFNIGNLKELNVNI